MTSPPPSRRRPVPTSARHPQPAPDAPQPGRCRSRGDTPGRRTRRHRHRRFVTALAAGCAVCAAFAVLTACEKPTPIATATSGQDSVHTETDCYDDGKAIPVSELQKCLGAKNHTTLGVDPDALVRFGVDPGIADRGWTLLMNGQPLTDTSHKTYRSVPGSVFFNQQYGATGPTSTVSILEGSGTKATGLWSFTFRRQS